MAKKDAIKLFISRESATYQFTRRQVELACTRATKGRLRELEVVHIEDSPEQAEKYNIEALPTLVIGNRRIIGTPNAESLDRLVEIVTSDTV